MNLPLKLAFRNLVKQKRRNILLGLGIGIGMTILVIFESFTGGLSDKLLNDIIVNMSGHLQVSGSEKIDGDEMTMIRDTDGMIATITNTLDGVEEVRESISLMVRAVGNGAGDFMVLVAMPDRSQPEIVGGIIDFYNDSELMSGDVNDWTNRSIENPVVIYQGKADKLNVTAGDVIKTRFMNLKGQTETARLYVVAVIESASEFQDTVCYTGISDLKEMMGYTEHETQALNVILEEVKNPYITIQYANQLHQALEPGPAIVNGTYQANGISVDGNLMAVTTNMKEPAGLESANTADQETGGLAKKIKAFIGKLTGRTPPPQDEPDAIEATILAQNVISGALGVEMDSVAELAESRDKMILSESLADALRLRAGDTVSFSYPPKYGEAEQSLSFTVAGIGSPEETLPGDLGVVNELDLYDFYYENMPAESVSVLPVSNRVGRIWDVITEEYILFERSMTTEELQRKKRIFDRSGWAGKVISVVSMQEVAQQFLMIEQGLNMVSFYVVMILFFIILIGVINSLRMSIRERTREIGTVRAIGMQKKMVSDMFLFEILLLALFACVGGILLGLIIVGILSLIPIQAEGFLAMFLDEGKLYLIPQVGGMLANTLVILVITFITALFPARKAAKMTVVEALRHFE